MPRRHLHSGIAMAVHSQISQLVKDNYEWSVQHDCWIAHCKDLAGLDPCRARNREDGRSVVPCPPDRRDAMFAAFRNFGMLDGD